MSDILVAPPWLLIAIAEIGVTEIPGAQNNARILEYQQATSLKASNDETPWCSSLVNWCMGEAGEKSTGSAAALSWQNYGIKLKHPCYGSIVVYDHGGGRGHVGFAVGYHQDSDDQYWLAVLGGNQSNQVKVSLFKGGTACAYVIPVGYKTPPGAYDLPDWTGKTEIETETL